MKSRLMAGMRQGRFNFMEGAKFGLDSLMPVEKARVHCFFDNVQFFDISAFKSVPRQDMRLVLRLVDLTPSFYSASMIFMHMIGEGWRAGALYNSPLAESLRRFYITEKQLRGISKLASLSDEKDVMKYDKNGFLSFGEFIAPRFDWRGFPQKNPFERQVELLKARASAVKKR